MYFTWPHFNQSLCRLQVQTQNNDPYLAKVLKNSSIYICCSQTYLMTLGIAPGFLHSSNLPWPFWGFFKQLPYIYNTALELELIWWVPYCAQNHWKSLVTRLTHAPVMCGRIDVRYILSYPAVAFVVFPTAYHFELLPEGRLVSD